MVDRLDPDFYGYRSFVARKDGLGRGGAGGGVSWNNVVIVDPEGGGDFTDLQEAIDSISSPSLGDEYLVLLVGGDQTTDYSITGSITLTEYVHLRGIGSRVPRVLITISSTTPGIQSVGTNRIENIDFIFSGSGTVAVQIDAADDTQFLGCGFNGSGTIIANDGRFRGCLFTSIDLEVSGSGTSHAQGPKFTACEFEGDYTLDNTAVTDVGYFGGCYFDTTRDANDSAFINISSPDISFSGCTVQSDDGAQIIMSGSWSGGKLFMDKGSASVVLLQNDGSFSGTDMHFTGNGSGGDTGYIELSSANNGNRPMSIKGCGITTQDSDKVFFFNSNYSSDAWPVVINGCTIIANTTGSGVLFGIHSSGCAGTPLIELNGNYIHAVFDITQLNNPHSQGQDLRLRGRDVRTQFFPVSPLHNVDVDVDFGAETVDVTNELRTMREVPVTRLVLSGEEAFVQLGRTLPIIDIDEVISTHLVLASDAGAENDTFTDSDATNLNAHTSDTGGSWTDVVGTISINSNKAQVGLNDLYTYDVTSANGFVRASFGNSSSSGTRTIRLIFRYSDTSNYWFVEWSRDDNSIRLYKRVSGSNTEMGASTLDVGGTAMTFGASFVGDDIIVYTGAGASPTNMIPVIRVEDDHNNTASSVGIGSGGTVTFTCDDFFFYLSADHDLTVTAECAHENEPFANQSQTQSFSAGGGTAAPAVHETPTLLNISTALNNFEQANFVSVSVALDDDAPSVLYVLGVQVHYLHTARDWRGDEELRQYKPFR